MASTNLMENIDKISSSTFFQSGQFSVAITSKLGRKGANGVRYGSFREQNYQLKTVADQPFVKSFDISNISDYLVFAFKGNINNVFTNEEIWVSYPHMENCITFFRDLTNYIITNETTIYQNGTLTETGENYRKDSEPMANGKFFTAIPDIMIVPEKPPINGITLFLTNEIGVFLGIDGLITLTEKIIRLDLQSASMLNLLIGMQLETYEMIKGNGVNTTSYNSNKAISSRSTGTTTRSVSRGNNLNRRVNTSGNRVSLDKTREETEIESPPEVESIGNTTNKRTIVRKTNSNNATNTTPNVVDDNDIDENDIPIEGVTSEGIQSVLNLAKDINLEELLND